MGKLRFHVLRHTAASLAIENHASDVHVASSAGSQDPGNGEALQSRQGRGHAGTGRQAGRGNLMLADQQIIDLRSICDSSACVEAVEQLAEFMVWYASMERRTPAKPSEVQKRLDAVRKPLPGWGRMPRRISCSR
jgi:hypothetical protein